MPHGQPHQGMPSPQGVIPETDYQEGEQPNVSPEEQAQYDQFMDNAFKLIYSDQTFPQVLARIKDSPDPTEALAATAVNVITRLEDSAKESGTPLSPDVIYRGGVEILEDLAQTAEKAGIHAYTEEELESALFQALDLYRQMGAKDGRLNQEPIQQDMAALVDVDKQGKLGELLPELQGKFGKGSAANG